MQKELLSAYIDGEHCGNKFTDTLCQNKDLQNSWSNYHLIRSIIRKESKVLLGSDFTARMGTLIEQEEKIQIEHSLESQTDTLSRRSGKTSVYTKNTLILFPMLQMAVAATVCFVAVLGVQSFNHERAGKNTLDTPTLQTLPFNNSVQEISYNVPRKEIITQEQVAQRNKRIGIMLQNYELQRRLHTDSFRLPNNEH